MQDVWNRIDAWLKANAPNVLATLKPGASDADIQALERHLGVRFPEDVKASMRIHDGQDGYKHGFYLGRELLSLERIRSEWDVWKDLLDSNSFEGMTGNADPGVQPHWWLAGWIPLTYDGGGNHECLDLVPAPGGRTGQIITMWHDEDTRQIIAPGFRELLSSFADGLEAGGIVYSDDYGGLVHTDDLA